MSNSAKKTDAIFVLVIIFLAGALAALCYVDEYKMIGTVNPVIDDTFIHLRFAWNLAHGQGFAFNPGAPISGSTSPLWVLILTPFALAGKEFLVHASIALSSISYALTGVMAWLLAKRLKASRPMALLAGLLVVMNGRLLWAGLSGMETDLFAALSLLAVIVYLAELERGRMTLRSGALLGLAAAVRPEGYMLFSGIICHYLIARSTAERDPRGLVKKIPWGAIIAFAAIIAPYMIFSLATTGHPLPSTFAAKYGELGRYRSAYLYWSREYAWLDNPVALVFLGLALLLLARRLGRERLSFLASGDALVAGWVVGYFIVSVVMEPMPFHFCRYQIPVIPFYLIMAARAAEEAAVLFRGRFAKAGARLPAEAAALMLAFLVPQAFSVARWPGITALCASNVMDMHVTVGRWLSRATPGNSVVATMDIGAIGFYSERRIVDMVGLITPEAVPYVLGKGVTEERSRALLRFLEKERPGYLAIFPAVYPGLTDDRRVFEPVYRVVLTRNQIAEDKWMEVFQCFWDRARP